MLQVTNLTVKFPSRRGEFTAVENVDISVKPGEIHGLVGESGAGKSTIGAAIIGLLQSPGYVAQGEMSLHDTNLRTLTPAQAHAVRGARISMIFQDPQTSLNPLMRIEDQLIETMQAHEDISDADARDRAVALLSEIGIKNAAERIKAYPHQFSGGMRQRVVIALALCTNPELIIADEPTTALDVAVQSQVLDLIRALADERGIGFILITHDIGVIAQITDKVTVLRGGKVMETGETAKILREPEHPYTQALLAAVPRLDKKIDRFLVPATEADVEAPQIISGIDAEAWLLDGGVQDPIGLQAHDITVKFAGERTSLFRKPDSFTALDSVSLDVRAGTVMGLVGESGSGKSTMAKVLTGLVQPSAGTMTLGNDALPDAKSRARKDQSRRIIQMVFQDPYSSLNSRHRVGALLAEPLWLYGLENDAAKRRALCEAMLSLVGLAPDAIDKYPHQFSGGQRQRIAVARALLARPRFLICDEPTSALDVSIQAQVLNLLKDLQKTFGLTMLFISHNLAVVRQMSDDITVLQGGKVMESGGSEPFFTNPQADYSKNLLSLTPTL
ncbi:peptide/nickel transport system ATP-binding protein [Loktanella ponticola]|uniref:Peptide/nickel transport system ATP-binding protein n=1 Tax=Yoonia ponticola TaxID=1524255 RepID=A0A7W9EYZ7_9RHOB|nr:ABC transporter ATP-binding protein [Yoonia ponticola]MBB5721391.1 peptide/nickel transport system ATP-binding protein [Yoonia ponticola]